jgi:crossover junction endodeoxyribonuclease RusA
VTGLPAPQGSKTARSICHQDALPCAHCHHRHIVNINQQEASKRVKPWRKLVRAAAVEAAGYDWMTITRPVVLWVVFSMPRPKSHYRSGKFAHLLRDDAPAYPAGGGNDTDKLERAVMDAITDAKVWADDALVVSLLGEKVYAGDGHPRALAEPGAWVTITVRDGE